MARDLRDLATQMTALVGKIRQANENLVSQVVVTIVADLAIHTPVDTSQAISNWQVGIGVIPQLELPPHLSGKHGTTYQQSSAETVKLALALMKDHEPGQTVYIVNNLKYIRALNDGSSAQEPAGFVERAELLGRKQLRNFKVSL